MLVNVGPFSMRLSSFIALQSTQTCNVPPGLGNNFPQNNLAQEGEHLGPGILGEGATGGERRGMLSLEASDPGLGGDAYCSTCNFIFCQFHLTRFLFYNSDL